MTTTSEAPRVVITLAKNPAGKRLVMHNQFPAVIVFHKDRVSVGCTDITPEALEYIHEEYAAFLNRGRLVLQNGKEEI